MKSVGIQDVRKIALVEGEMPRPKQGEALLKMKMVGICGSDIKAFTGHGTKVPFPIVIGHEGLGEILEISPENTKGLAPGDLVAIDPYLYCGNCYPCTLERTNCCESLQCLGVHTDGCMSEYFSYPEHLLHKVPTGIPEELVPLAEPLTIALHALHRTCLKAGERIVIFGAGAIGMLSAMASLHYGADPIVVDVVPERLKFAKSLGVRHAFNSRIQNIAAEISAVTNGRMAEVVMEATGANTCIHDTIAMASYCGRIALTGWPDGETSIDTFSVTRKELQLYGSRNSKNEFTEALELIEQGKVNVRAILSEVVPFDQLPDAVERMAANPGKYIKIVGRV